MVWKSSAKLLYHFYTETVIAGWKCQRRQCLFLNPSLILSSDRFSFLQRELISQCTTGIILKKLLFLHHLATLPSNSLAAEIYQLQKEDSSLPGLVRDCEEYLSSLNISSDPSSFSKYQWGGNVKANLHAKNKNDLLQQINSYKKLDK